MCFETGKCLLVAGAQEVASTGSLEQHHGEAVNLTADPLGSGQHRTSVLDQRRCDLQGETQNSLVIVRLSLLPLASVLPFKPEYPECFVFFL